MHLVINYLSSYFILFIYLFNYTYVKTINLRMSVTELQFANWLGPRKHFMVTARLIRDAYARVNEDAVHKACAEAWRSQDTGAGMEVMRALINRLCPQKSKSEVWKELGDFIEDGTKDKFREEDRINFNLYAMRFPAHKASGTTPKRTGGSPKSGEPESGRRTPKQEGQRIPPQVQKE